jgi:starvation-inducible DNA-binding protein
MYLNAPTSLPAAVREQVGSVLNHALADEFALSAAARDYHWNVTGPQSRSLTELFDQQYHQVDQWIEKIADRARMIGIVAQTGWSELIQAPRIAPQCGADLDARAMMVALAALHECMVERLQSDADICANEYGDSVTAELLHELVEYHETSAWMLGELLEDPELAEAG